MDSHTQAVRRVFVESPKELTDTPSSSDAPTHDADPARSENNILQWRSYLPEDCIKTMIDMGWDVTT